MPVCISCRPDGSYPDACKPSQAPARPLLALLLRCSPCSRLAASNPLCARNRPRRSSLPPHWHPCQHHRPWVESTLRPFLLISAPFRKGGRGATVAWPFHPLLTDQGSFPVQNPHVTALPFLFPQLETIQNTPNIQYNVRHVCIEYSVSSCARHVVYSITVVQARRTRYSDEFFLQNITVTGVDSRMLKSNITSVVRVPSAKGTAHRAINLYLVCETQLDCM